MAKLDVKIRELVDPTLLSDAEATRLGLKQYLADIGGGANDVAYNGGIKATITGGWTTVFRAVLIPYQMQDGAWRLKGQVIAQNGSLTSSDKTITINGILSKNVSGYYQTFACQVSNSSSCGPACSGYDASAKYMAPNGNSFTVGGGGTTFNYGYISFDIELNAKPTWAY